jgi:5-formyltetrahydrofolate cyclo-ligase
MRKRIGPLSLGVSIGLLLSLLALPLPGYTQPAPKPAVQQARIVVTMTEGGADSVEATYTLQNTTGLRDGVIEHILARRPGAEVGDIQASGAATGAHGVVARREGMARVNVPVSGEPATYTLRYTVHRAPGTFAVPILAPGIPVARSEPNVTIETLLPAGMRQQGEWFPSVERIESREGRTVLVHRVINVPSVAIAEYGQGGSFFSLSLLVTLAGLAVLLPILAWWFRHVLARRPALAAAS